MVFKNREKLANIFRHKEFKSFLVKKMFFLN
ncbi:MAG: hypothetical protein MRERC_1c053 [Mycoplasmataceae bacterium RC_NB112A]|nr:MAG: hypothetical protein MRERC_1c053 [Mycoplasmataceae bacterium RC_NB112A]